MLEFGRHQLGDSASVSWLPPRQFFPSFFFRYEHPRSNGGELDLSCGESVCEALQVQDRFLMHAPS